MGIGPVPAVRKLFDRTGVSVDELDLVELNEAFASQSLAVIRELGLDAEKVNVNGGAIAMGHPLGMSGARLVVSLLHELRRRRRPVRSSRRSVSGLDRARQPCSSAAFERRSLERVILCLVTQVCGENAFSSAHATHIHHRRERP